MASDLSSARTPKSLWAHPPRLLGTTALTSIPLRSLRLVWVAIRTHAAAALTGISLVNPKPQSLNPNPESLNALTCPRSTLSPRP